MATTTIRVDKETHATLLELSSDRGVSLMETVKLAADVLRRQRFAQGVASQLVTLRADPSAWKAYLAEADSTVVTDGVS